MRKPLGLVEMGCIYPGFQVHTYCTYVYLHLGWGGAVHRLGVQSPSSRLKSFFCYETIPKSPSTRYKRQKTFGFVMISWQFPEVARKTAGPPSQSLYGRGLGASFLHRIRIEILDFCAGHVPQLAPRQESEASGMGEPQRCHAKNASHCVSFPVLFFLFNQRIRRHGKKMQCMQEMVIFGCNGYWVLA